MIEKIDNQIIGESIYLEKLDNGLPVYILPRKGYNRTYGLVGVKCGSIDLEFEFDQKMNSVPSGIAHFLEHKLFEDKEENIFDKFAALGASTNAYTSFTSTNYLFSTTSNFKESLLNLLDFVQTPYFTEENINKEKGIIAQEIKMYEDDPNWQAFFNMLQGLYVNYPVRYDIPGTVESIQKINCDNLYTFYNAFYHPRNMVLFITGDLDKDLVLEMIRENQDGKNLSSTNDLKRNYPQEPDRINREEYHKKMDVTRPIFDLGFKENKLADNPYNLIKQEIVTNILLEILLGQGSELFEYLYDKGLVDESLSFNYNLEPGYGFIRICGETKKPEQLFAELLDRIYNSREKITEENFRRIYNKYLGEYIQGFNSFEVIASEFISFYFRGINLLEALDIMKEITLEEILNKYGEIFKKEWMVKSVVS